MAFRVGQDDVLAGLMPKLCSGCCWIRASRARVEDALTLPRSKAKLERGEWAISLFMSIATLR